MKQYCSFGIQSYYFTSSACTDAAIIKSPENTTAPIGAIVSFHCLAQGDDAFWEINDTAIEYPEDRASFTYVQ